MIKIFQIFLNIFLLLIPFLPIINNFKFTCLVYAKLFSQKISLKPEVLCILSTTVYDIRIIDEYSIPAKVYRQIPTTAYNLPTRPGPRS